MRIKMRFDCRVWSATLLVAWCGCTKGPPLAEVSGKVTYNGQPVHNARVDFDPLGDGKSSVGYSDDEGEYEIQYTINQSGALIGRHKVSVVIYPEPGRKAPPVPERYSNAQVEFDVKSGSNRFDIELNAS